MVGLIHHITPKLLGTICFNKRVSGKGHFGIKPDYADSQGERGPDNALPAPGSAFAYNDVRVNRLALSLLRIWRKPLPQLLKAKVMDPIGASNSWRWHGYRNSWLTIDGAEDAVGQRRWSLGRWGLD